MMSNFEFLTESWDEFSGDAKAMERLVRFDPKAACARARYLIEQVVLWMYENDEDLEMPLDSSLYNITQLPEFIHITGRPVQKKINLIRRSGNNALHKNIPVRESEAMQICEEAFHVMYWLYQTYVEEGQQVRDVTFRPDRVPDIRQQPAVSQDKLIRLQEQLEEQADELRRVQQSLQGKDEELGQRKREIKQMRLQSRRFADSHDYNEAQTRELLIDVMLRESGWDPGAPDVREYKVQGMPGTSGTGYVDYVLWDDNGKPLALVEAKRTTRSYNTGKHQAELYANGLEAEFGIRPVIFLSNGYEIWIWDDTAYPPREISGFYSKETLQELHFRRHEKEPLKLAKVKEEISGRYYQIAAIRRVGERFDEGHRQALLVMATGTGKTRTAISVCDVMLRKKWAKRILFLADRNALVKQAYKNFADLLPDVPIVNLVKEKNDDAARIVFSTYPTMLNQVERLEEGKRKFDPGTFDLVIIDEAHRSVYNKYKAVIDYFDALLLGLTATPREDVDRDTYQLFNAEQGNPTFAYELEEAIRDDFLVEYKTAKVRGKFLSEGIKYSELSEEEKKEYDDLLADDETGSVPKHIDPGKLNRWLFNKDTVDQVLKQLMEHGIKVEGGDRLGDTIIFAKNQRHATFIQERFDLNFPHLRGLFAKVIHNQVDQAQDLIETFCHPQEKPHIAISVDMMDTGIDAPACVNLVFFKPVRSKTKFHQMLGRGTRLFPDLFGPGKDKSKFLVFDYCGNFDFFEMNPDGYRASHSPSVTAQIFEKRLLLASKLAHEPHSRDPELREYRVELLDLLHGQVAGLERQSVQVRPKLKLVDRLSARPVWDHLEALERNEIVRELAELIPADMEEDERSRRFDLLMITLQLEELDDVLHEKNHWDIAMDLADKLHSNREIPAIRKVLPAVKKAASEAFWEDPGVRDIEEIRKQLRSLMHLIREGGRNPIYTDFEDEFGEVVITDAIVADPSVNPVRYLRRIRNFISENRHHLVIEKIRNARPLTSRDVETLERFLIEFDPAISPGEFQEIVGEQMDLISFVRSASGLDRKAVMKRFETFLQDNRMSSNQIRFIEKMIDFYTQNGRLEVADLYAPPFSFIDQDGIDGVFRERDEVVSVLIERVRDLNQIKIG